MGILHMDMVAGTMEEVDITDHQIDQADLIDLTDQNLNIL